MCLLSWPKSSHSVPTQSSMLAGRGHHFGQCVFQVDLGSPAENIACLMPVGQGVASFTGACREIDFIAADDFSDAVDAYVAASSDVESATIGDSRVHRPQVSPHDIMNMGKIARLLPIAKNCERLT